MRRSRFAWGSMVLGALLVLGCGSKSPLEEAKALIQTEPEQAVRLLIGLQQDRPDDYEPIYLLGQAYEAKGDAEHAAEWYERAIQHPRGQKTKNLLGGKLYEAYRQLAERERKDPAKFEALVRKAAVLEQQLEKRNTVANEQLFLLLTARFDQAKAEKRFDDALRVAEEIGRLYYHKRKLAPYLKQIDALRKERQAHECLQAFETQIKPAWTADGTFDADQGLVKVASVFDVPAKPGPDGKFDPAAPTFADDVAAAACQGAREALAQRITQFADATPLRLQLTPENVQTYWAEASKRKQEGFEPPDADPRKRLKRGEKVAYRCGVAVPLEFVIAGFLQILSEQPTGAATPQAVPSPGPAAAPDGPAATAP